MWVLTASRYKHLLYKKNDLSKNEWTYRTLCKDARIRGSIEVHAKIGNIFRIRKFVLNIANSNIIFHVSFYISFDRLIALSMQICT